MTALFLAFAVEPGPLALGFSAVSIIIAVCAVFIARRSMATAKDAYDRGGYEITVDAEAFTKDLPPYSPEELVRRTDVVITVTNHRMGKVQLSRFHGEIDGIPAYEIGVDGPELGHTFDGIQAEAWHAGWNEKRKVDAPLSPQSRVRVGGELANGEIVWSEWIKVDSSAADKVLAPKWY